MREINTPITGINEGNSCPICSSRRISVFKQFSALKEYDMKGREIIKVGGKRIQKPSNNLLACYYSAIDIQEPVCVYYKCRRCDWESEIYTP